MVQALLEGRKTMTRRTKGLADSYPENVIFERSNSWPKQGNWIAKYKVNSNPDIFRIENIIKCPYEVGDVFWVRENFYTASNWDHWKPSALKSVNVEVFYEADRNNDTISKPLHRGKSRPSIFLPSEYCRIFLKIKSIRVERLQDISEEDVKAEGVKLNISQNGQILFELGSENNALSFLDNDSKKWDFPAIWKAHWAELWCKINGIESWNQNPFVFVYEFEQIEKPLNFIV